MATKSPRRNNIMGIMSLDDLKCLDFLNRLHWQETSRLGVEFWLDQPSMAEWQSWSTQSSIRFRPSPRNNCSCAGHDSINDLFLKCIQGITENGAKYGLAKSRITVKVACRWKSIQRKLLSYCIYKMRKNTRTVSQYIIFKYLETVKPKAVKRLFTPMYL